MKLAIFNMFAIAGATLLNGCIGVSVTKIEHNEPDSICVSAAASAQKGKTPVVPGKIVLSDEPDLLRLKIVFAGKDSEAKLFADELKPSITGALADSCAKITAGKSDLTLFITPKFQVIDTMGEYCRMNCTVSVEIRNEKRTFSAKKFSFSGGRKLGKDESVKQFTPVTEKAVADWVKIEMNRISEKEIRSDMIAIQIRESKDKTEEATAVKQIGNELQKMQGILGYEFLGKTKEGRCCYRVTYMKASYPHGIMTAIYAAIPQKTK